MADFLTPQTLALFLLFSVPGIVMLYFRAQFLTGKLPPVGEGVISYVTLSLVYHAIIYPVVAPLYRALPITGWLWLGWFAVIFIGPGAVGLLLGLNIRKGWSKWLVNKLGINTIHPVNCAWDWRFGQCEEGWVIAKLKDGTTWGGYLGTNSFMSSDTAERDIFIESVYSVSEGSEWEPRSSSVWIAHGEIQSLEFLPKSGSDTNA